VSYFTDLTENYLSQARNARLNFSLRRAIYLSGGGFPCPGVAAWIVHSQKQIDAFPFAGFSRSGGKANRPLALKCSATDLSIALRANRLRGRLRVTFRRTGGMQACPLGTRNRL
jgi:hypothetical protein